MSNSEVTSLREQWRARDGEAPPAPASPLVSVSMLTYNAAPFIREAIESVLDQETDFAVELVIGDDNSQDGTREVLREYAAQYPGGIRLHLHAVRGAGVPGRVNNMHNLGDCRGRYVAILDGDDYWTDPRKLLDQARFLESHPGHSACSCNGVVLLPDGSELDRMKSRRQLLGADVTLDFFTEHDMTGMLPTSLMFRRAWALPLPAWFPEVLVADLYIKLLLLQRGPCHFLPGSYYAYRQHEQNFTARELVNAKGLLAVYDDRRRMRRVLPWLPASRVSERRQLQRLRRVLSAAIEKRDYRLALAAVSRLRYHARLTSVKPFFMAGVRAARKLTGGRAAGV